MAQQLRDACRKWLMAEERDIEEVVDLVVLEQFIARLPRGTAEWVQCHRPTSLTQAIQLAEDHLVACPGVGEPLHNLSLHPPSLPALSRPITAPRSRNNAPPLIPPRSNPVQGNRFASRGGGAESTGAAAPSPQFSSLRQSLGQPSAAGSGGKAWAGLLEMRGPGSFSGPVSDDGGGNVDPGPRLPGGCPRSSWAVPNTLIGGEMAEKRFTDLGEGERGSDCLWETEPCVLCDGLTD
ncbi:zinc finger protein with KRAB and SCAN domains 7-like [Onychostoma macrolepis]|uniref:zinc finger protein with KRAB and SCAN domains 7-like n=1 Tax=Onychostoma macrolepis TaxID=369639 RepID=UPI00272A8089|nr:zinc finger protein with KRAB and SCAN domains 7-like [Onychostoma macrolepis]